MSHDLVTSTKVEQTEKSNKIHMHWKSYCGPHKRKTTIITILNREYQDKMLHVFAFNLNKHYLLP